MQNPVHIFFDVNRFYVLRVEFDDRDNLIELAIEPKYYYEESEPEWKQSDDFENLSKEQFSKLLAQVKELKNLGELKRAANTISIVTNMTASRTELYQNGTLTWGEVVDLRKGKNPPYEVRWFKLKFGEDAKMSEEIHIKQF